MLPVENKKSVSLIQYYYRVIFFLLIFFIAFDGVRDSLIFSDYLSYVREATILLAFIPLIRSLNFKFKISLFSFSLLMMFFVFSYGSVYSVFPIYPDLRSVSDPLVVLYKHFQFFILLFCFVNIEKLTGQDVKYYAALLVYMLVFIAVITPIVYISPPSFFKSDFLQWGRMGIGYPTMDAQIFCFGIIIILYMLDFNRVLNNIVLGCLIVGVLMQVTATGMFTLFSICMFFIFLDKKNKISSFLPLFLGLFFVVSYIITLYSDDLTKILWLASDKIDNLMNYGQGQSTQIRHEQFEFLFNIINSRLDLLLFGIGSNVYVENQYSFFFIAFGLVGLVVYLGYIFIMMVIGIKSIRIDHGLFFLSTMIFALVSYSLITFYLYSLYAMYAFMTAYHIINCRKFVYLGK